MTWLYLLKDLSEVESVFKTFSKEITVQFGKDMCCVPIKHKKISNKKEFLFAMRMELFHQTSYCHTHKQSGVVKRKNRHLDMVCSILIHKHMAKRVRVVGVMLY